MADSSPIVSGLREIGWLLSLRGDDRFRSRAYRKAAEALAGFDGDLEGLIESGRVTELAGIGKGTARVIGELHQTGRARLLSELRRGFPREVGRLARIPGLGLARLEALHRQLGIETVEDLRAACASGAVAQLRGFGPATVSTIVDALQAVEATPARLLLPVARQLAAELTASWSEILGRPLEITGAIRRREVAIETIELLGVGQVDRLPALPRATGWRALPDPSDAASERQIFRGQLLHGVPVELSLAPADRMGAARVRTTGPPAFANAVLDRAQGGLDDEAATLASAGLPWVPPELRRTHRLGDPVPTLIEAGDLRGVVHVHTTDSDGRDDLLSLARAVRDKGYGYLTVTDHSPSARYANGVSLARLREQAELTKRVEEETGVRVLRGTESDILREGGLDHPLEVLGELDVVIASIHGRFRADRETMTARLLKTFDLPIRVIWGHPLGRLVLSRPPIEVDLPRVLDRIAERGHILEVNGDPHRMDLPPEWIREARARGIPFVVSADAHSVRGLDMMADTGIDCARAGGLGPAEVLNTLEVDAFVEAVRPG